MDVRLSKEWRLLRPGLVAALGLAVVPLMLPVDAASREYVSYVIALCTFVGGVLLGTETFGREFHQQTSTLWLSLPMSRAGLWRSKLTMIGAAVVGVTLVQWLTLLAGTPWRGFPPSVGEMMRPALALVGGATLGVCWSLFLRQTWAAFWMALIVPGALMLLIQLPVTFLWPRSEMDTSTPERAVGALFAIGFCVVTVMAYFVARRAFERLEDLGPVGEDVQFKAPGFVRSWLQVDARSERLTRCASSSLWWKEIRLQQVNLALAVGLGLVIVLMHLLRQAAWSMSDRFSPRNFDFVDFLWALWVLLPLTVGLATVAEERRLGVESWQETLPVSRVRRWWIKIGAAYAISFVIGVIVPVVGGMIIYDGTPSGALRFLVIAWLLMTTAGIYVSSLARNLVHAISILVPFTVALALVMWGGLWLTHVLSQQPMDAYGRIPIKLHFRVVTGGLFFVVLLWLAWRNCVPGGDTLRRALGLNVGLLAAALIAGVLLVSGTRARAWEWLRPEPKAGRPLTVHPAVQPDVAVGWMRVVILTPDGNLWHYGVDLNHSVSSTKTVLRQLGEDRGWLSFGATDRQMYAVRTDGTLWSWGTMPGRESERAQGAWGISPTQVGMDTDWQAVATAWHHTAALKENGTLWGWGGNDRGQLGQPEADYVPTPVQIGVATNWTHVTVGTGITAAANGDGEVWEWGWMVQPPRGTAEDSRRLWVARQIASGIQWQRLFRDVGGILGVSAGGEVWILRSYVAGEGSTFPVRWEGSPARDATMGWDDSWSVDEQGRLVRWRADRRNLRPVQAMADVGGVRRVGHRSDWIALGRTDTCFGLTADGGLWVWGTPFGHEEELWFPPSQRPRQVALLRDDEK
jgi:hypothetical protein